MEALRNNTEIINISDIEIVNLVKHSYKFYRKNYVTFNIEAIKLRYLISNQCKLITIVEIYYEQSDESYFYYFKNNNICSTNIYDIKDATLIDMEDIILPKKYNYLNTNMRYRIYNKDEFKDIDFKSKTGIKIMGVYFNFLELFKKDQINIIDILVLEISEPHVVIELIYKDGIKYFDEELKLKDEIPEIFAKNKEEIYKLNKHPYEYLD